MEFLKKLSTDLGFKTKKELALALGKDAQGYYSLERATERLGLRDIVALRHLSGMTDSKLLDLIEQEAALDFKPTRRPGKLATADKTRSGG